VLKREATVWDKMRQTLADTGLRKPIQHHFYSMEPHQASQSPSKPKLELNGEDVSALVDGLNSLGLTTATAAQVQRGTQELFPGGTEGIDQAEVLRAVFFHLQRQNSANNVR
jgi:hypothetical protein